MTLDLIKSEFHLKNKWRHKIISNNLIQKEAFSEYMPHNLTYEKMNNIHIPKDYSKLPQSMKENRSLNEIQEGIKENIFNNRNCLDIKHTLQSKKKILQIREKQEKEKKRANESAPQLNRPKFNLQLNATLASKKFIERIKLNKMETNMEIELVNKEKSHSKEKKNIKNKKNKLLFLFDNMVEELDFRKKRMHLQKKDFLNENLDKEKVTKHFGKMIKNIFSQKEGEKKMFNLNWSNNEGYETTFQKVNNSNQQKSSHTSFLFNNSFNNEKSNLNKKLSINNVCNEVVNIHVDKLKNKSLKKFRPNVWKNQNHEEK